MAANLSDPQSEDNGSEVDSHEYSREELLSSNPFTLVNFSNHKLRYMALFDVEHWMIELKDLTFPTAVEKVEWAEAVAVQHFYQEGVCSHRNKITDDDTKALARLQGKIDALISQLTLDNNSQGFFVRLGPRSPKDAPMLPVEPPQDMALANAALCGISESKLADAFKKAAGTLAHQGDEGSKADAHEVLGRFQDVCLGLLRVTSAEDALRLLVSSSRVMGDVSHTLDQGEAGWSMSVVVREWDDAVKLEREFRTFVVGGEVTAISQYDDQLMYPFVAAHPEQIVAAITECLAPAKATLQSLSANRGVVVDFLVVPSGHGGTPWQARIIELNPFGPMTGASLFTWTSDRRVLQGGQDLYGDLDECEGLTPPGSIPLPLHVNEKVILGVPFRHLAQNPPGFSWEKLSVYWEAYVRLAPQALLQKRP